MTSEVAICNMALGHLGDRATVSSIDPPEGSPQAGHCAMFYGPTRDALLEMHTWGFTKRRIALGQVSNPSSTWQYAYAKPDLATSILAILDPQASDDFSSSALSLVDSIDMPMPIASVYGIYTPQAFDTESASDGSEIILTNQALAVCRYTVKVTDAGKFSSLFVKALSWFLAAELAGPVLKGETGAAAAIKCEKQGAMWLSQARTNEAVNRSVKPQHQVPWLAARG